MNNLKRIFSCLSIFATCLLINLGVEVKSAPLVPLSGQTLKDISQDESFILYDGTTTISQEDVKIASHYSHRSHYSHSSHSSHYSSRY